MIATSVWRSASSAIASSLVVPFTLSGTGNRVVYRADPEFAGTYELYSSPLSSQPLEGETPTDFVRR